MKKYLFIVLLVGVCFGQLSVKSSHDLQPFEIDGGLVTTVSREWKEDDLIEVTSIANTIYEVRGQWNCQDNKNCDLKLSWIVKSEEKIDTSYSKIGLTKDQIDNLGLDKPMLDSFLAIAEIGKKARKESSMLISDIDGLIEAIIVVDKYIFDKNDTEIEFKLKRDSGKIYKKKDDYLEIVTFMDSKLKIKSPDDFISNLKSWKNEKPVEEEPKKFVVYDDPPKPISAIKPKYPKKAEKEGIEGVVVVQAFVDEKGKVVETLILKGITKELNKAAIKAIEKTKFIPAKQKGKKVGVWISIPVNFRLK